MKVIIKENERGLLFKNGMFIRMLSPGKHSIKQFFGETYARALANEPFTLGEADISVFLRDKAFADGTSRIEVPDGCIALHTENGRIVGALKPGAHCFWNNGREHGFNLIDISDAEIRGLTPAQLMYVPHDMYKKIEVPEGEAGLLFYDGKYIRRLESGSYYFWNNMQRVQCHNVDLRAQQLDIAGQEILTADKVSLRINFMCVYRVTDAEKIISEIKDYKTQVYTYTQLALRGHVGKFRFDELLEQKDSIAATVLERLSKNRLACTWSFWKPG